MKLKDWYNFNFGNEQFKCTIGDIYVKVFRKESYKNEDVILEQLMKPNDMIHPIYYHPAIGEVRPKVLDFE